MGAMQISYVNHADAGALSGGAWLTALPLPNLLLSMQARIARSTNATAAATQMQIDLGSAQLARLVGLVRHNCSVGATYRITAGTTLGGSQIYDSGTLPVWPSVYLPSDLEWEDDNWWLGTISQADAAGYPISLWHDCGENVRAQYWRIEIFDTANPAGYVQAARLWIGQVWSPQVNYGLGGSLTWEARAEEERSLGGVLYFDQRPSARVFRFELAALSDVEAFGWALDMQRRVGTSREVVVIPDPDDAQRRFKRDLLGRLRRLDPLEQWAVGHQSTGYEVEELL